MCSDRDNVDANNLVGRRRSWGRGSAMKVGMICRFESERGGMSTSRRLIKHFCVSRHGRAFANNRQLTTSRGSFGSRAGPMHRALADSGLPFAARRTPHAAQAIVGCCDSNAAQMQVDAGRRRQMQADATSSVSEGDKSRVPASLDCRRWQLTRKAVPLGPAARNSLNTPRSRKAAKIKGAPIWCGQAEAEAEAEAGAGVTWYAN